jgi:uncharacterized OB-fold protein
MEVPRHWRLKAQRYRLEGSVCPICGQLSFPPRSVCRHDNVRLVKVTGYAVPLFTTSQREMECVSSKSMKG